jgi:predicted nucleic acid-binding protein
MRNRRLENADLRDLQIAAIARSQGWTVATRNTKHFPLFQLSILSRHKSGSQYRIVFAKKKKGLR